MDQLFSSYSLVLLPTLLFVRFSLSPVGTTSVVSSLCSPSPSSSLNRHRSTTFTPSSAKRLDYPTFLLYRRLTHREPKGPFPTFLLQSRCPSRPSTPTLHSTPTQNQKGVLFELTQRRLGVPYRLSRVDLCMFSGPLDHPYRDLMTVLYSKFGLFGLSSLLLETYPVG